jgi:predicted nucleic acid-binding protein
MQGKVFIDSNIFIYAKIEDKEKDKHILARLFLNSLREKVEISTQVINEFYNVLDKYKIEDMIIQEKLKIINPFEGTSR